MLNDVTIVIPTKGRAHKQTTLVSLPPVIRRKVRLVVYQDEAKLYRNHWPDQPLWVVPKHVQGIADKRRYLIENVRTRYLLMLDDDFRFCYRPTMKKPSLIYLEKEDDRFVRMFTRMRELGDRYIHVGVSHRSGNHTQTKPLKKVGRIAGAYLYDLVRLKKAKVKLGRVEVMEDFDVTLQLLRKGYANVILVRYCYNHMGYSNAKGGCSSYRTLKVQRRAALKLAELHHPFVKVVKRKAPTWQGMTKRTDVIVYWKKAYASSQQRKNPP
jgi:hypothetical protein